MVAYHRDSVEVLNRGAGGVGELGRLSGPELERREVGASGPVTGSSRSRPVLTVPGSPHSAPW